MMNLSRPRNTNHRTRNVPIHRLIASPVAPRNHLILLQQLAPSMRTPLRTKVQATLSSRWIHFTLTLWLATHRRPPTALLIHMLTLLKSRILQLITRRQATSRHLHIMDIIVIHRLTGCLPHLGNLPKNTRAPSNQEPQFHHRLFRRWNQWLPHHPLPLLRPPWTLICSPLWTRQECLVFSQALTCSQCKLQECNFQLSSCHLCFNHRWCREWYMIWLPLHHLLILNHHCLHHHPLPCHDSERKLAGTWGKQWCVLKKKNHYIVQ